MLIELWMITVFVLIPGAGIALYLAVLRQMDRADVRSAPRMALSKVFAAYGLVLLFALTLISPMGYSGMHGLGLIVLTCVVGPGLGVQAYAMRGTRETSPYHRAACLLSAAFYPTFAVSLIAATGLSVLL